MFLVLVFSDPGVRLSYLYLCLLLSLVGSFSCLCFCFFCLLLGSSFSSLFFLFLFYLVPSCRPGCCASLSGSFFLGFALLRSFLSSAPLGGWGGEVFGSGTVSRYLDNRWWSLLLIRGFLHGFCSLFSVPPAVASGSSSLPPAASLLAPPSSSLGLRL